MAKNQAVWGLDLGRCALKAVKLRVGADDKVEIAAHDYIEHAKILSQPDADRVELISSALEKFLSRNDISKDAVVIGVPGQHTLARFTKLPPVAPKKIPDIVRYEADQQIPFDMDEVIWDYQTFQREGLPDLEVGIFAMKRELLREHLLHFEQASIEPIAVQCGPLAVYNAAHYDGLLGENTTILLDVGAENTELVIATPDSFWTRTVPIGGNRFTEALVKAFKLSFSKAEGLKRTADASKYARQVFQAMRPVFADLVQELQRSIGFYSSTHRDTKVDKAVCLGNASRLPGLQKYLQQNLGLTVEKPSTFKKASPTGSAGGGDYTEQFLSFAAAYGLAVQGLDLARVTSNLLPVELAKQTVWRKKKPTFAATAACLVLAGGLIWYRQFSDMRALAAGSQARVPSPGSVEEAWSIINNGPSASLPERAQAQAILAAGDVLKKELGNLGGQGDMERRQAEDLIEAQKNKALISRIVQVIHQSVPVPQGALGQATTPAEVLAAVQADAPSREERGQVLIDRLNMQYQPDVNEVIWTSIVEVEPPINDPEAVLSAVKVEIGCRTGQKDATKFISEVFMNELRKNGRQPGLGFYFDRVYLFDGRKAEIQSETKNPLTSGGGAFGSYGRGGGFAGTASGGTAASTDPATLDPVTQEPMTSDWSFEIWIDVILQEFPGSDEPEPAAP